MSDNNNFLTNQHLKNEEQDPLIINLVAQMEQTNIMMRNYVRVLAEIKEVRSQMSENINSIMRMIDNQQKLIDILFVHLNLQKPKDKEEVVLDKPTKEIILNDTSDLKTEDFQEKMIQDMINNNKQNNNL